jgi:hypothetical protein
MFATNIECEAKCCDGWTIDENGQCSVRMYLSFFCVFVKKGGVLFISFIIYFKTIWDTIPVFKSCFVALMALFIF